MSVWQKNIASALDMLVCVGLLLFVGLSSIAHALTTGPFAVFTAVTLVTSILFFVLGLRVALRGERQMETGAGAASSPPADTGSASNF